MSYVEQFDAGMAALREERWADALTALSACAELEPERGEAWLFLGIAQGLTGQFDQAGQSLGRAGELSPGDARVPYNQGRLALRQGDETAARERFVAALDLDATFDRASQALAELDRRPAVAPTGLATAHGMVRMVGVEGRSVLRVALALSLGMAAVQLAAGLLELLFGLALGAPTKDALNQLGASAIVVLATPLAMVLAVVLGLPGLRLLLARGQGPWVRLEPAGERVVLKYIDAGSAGTALLAWSALPIALMLAGCMVGATVLALWSTAGGASSESHLALAMGLGLGAVLGLVAAPVGVGLGGALLGLIYNLAANLCGGAQFRLALVGEWTELADLAVRPAIRTFLLMAVPAVALNVVMALITVSGPQATVIGVVSQVGGLAAMVVSVVVKVLIYDRVQHARGGYLVALSPQQVKL